MVRNGALTTGAEGLDRWARHGRQPRQSWERRCGRVAGGQGEAEVCPRPVVCERARQPRGPQRGRHGQGNGVRCGAGLGRGVCPTSVPNSHDGGGWGVASRTTGSDARPRSSPCPWTSATEPGANSKAPRCGPDTGAVKCLPTAGRNGPAAAGPWVPRCPHVEPPLYHIGLHRYGATPCQEFTNMVWESHGR